MTQHNNDIDNQVDNDIYRCMTPGDLKSFFLFAGAGSGKTRTLTNVLTRFKEEHGTSYKFRNKNIAIITYTNAAADEIKRRLKYSSIFSVTTIHSFSWELIRHFSADIRAYLNNSLIVEIAELEEQQAKSRDLNNKTSLGRAKKIESKTERLRALAGIRKFIYNPNGDNITTDSLNHSEVIAIVADFIRSKPLFKQIVVNKFPIILIDESQDTKKELIEALFLLQSQYKAQFSLGLLGDTMQRIYSDGKENLGVGLPADWIQPAKKMNHRSKSRIVDLINKIRTSADGQQQVPRVENSGGTVRLFAVSRAKNRHETEKLICEKMRGITHDEKWLKDSTDVMTLTLEHHMAAGRMGFSTFFDPLYGIDKLKTSLLDGSSSSINLFSKIVLPLHQAYVKSNKFEIANIIRKNSDMVSKQLLKGQVEKLSSIHSANEKVMELLSLWSEDKDPTLFEILDKVNTTKLFKVPPTLRLVLARKGATVSVVDEDEEEPDPDEEIFTAWEEALGANFSEIIAYSKYVNDKSMFGTHQGVKGLEFERVMVVIDEEESRGFLFNYDKLFGMVPLTKGDHKNIEEGKETGVDRTLRLLYVACSRAKESLALVAYTDSPEQLKNNVVTYGWFTEDEVEMVM